MADTAGLRRSYLAFNAALGSLYETDLLELSAGIPGPDFDDTAFFDAAGMVYNTGGFDASQLATPEARRLIAETLKQLKTAIASGVPHEVPETVRYALENNAFIFSGFKAFHTLREAGLFLLAPDGSIKPFETFRKDVETVNNRYNHNYLYAEYNHAVGASLMASRWQQIEKDGDRYDLQYRTAQDDRVREDHAILHGTTLPPSDPFWSLYLPPNGWNCRCTAVQVRKGKYPQSDPALSMLRGNNCTENARQQIFRFNPGKDLKLFPPKHPYYKAPEAAKQVIEQLANIEENRRTFDRLANDSDYTDVEFDEKSGGVRAMHVGHNTKCNSSEILKWNMTGADLENEAVDLLFRSGHSVILCDESKMENGNRLPALDLVLDGVLMDIRSITENKAHYGSAIGSKNNQLHRYNARADIPKPADSVCLYFHEAAMYNPDKITNGIDWLTEKTSNVITKHIVCVVRQSDGSVKVLRHNFD